MKPVLQYLPQNSSSSALYSMVSSFSTKSFFFCFIILCSFNYSHLRIRLKKPRETKTKHKSKNNKLKKEKKSLILTFIRVVFVAEILSGDYKDESFNFVYIISVKDVYRVCIFSIFYTSLLTLHLSV